MARRPLVLRLIDIHFARRSGQATCSLVFAGIRYPWAKMKGRPPCHHDFMAITTVLGQPLIIKLLAPIGLTIGAIAEV